MQKLTHEHLWACLQQQQQIDTVTTTTPTNRIYNNSNSNSNMRLVQHVQHVQQQLWLMKASSRLVESSIKLKLLVLSCPRPAMTKTIQQQFPHQSSNQSISIPSNRPAAILLPYNYRNYLINNTINYNLIIIPTTTTKIKS